MGLSLTADKVKVYKKEHEGSNGTWYSYSLSVASKNMNGEWVNGYIDASFKKGVTVNNKSIIAIKNAFPTVSKSNDRTFIKWMIMDFDVVEDGEAQAANNDSDDVPNFMDIPFGEDAELPFQ